jgi:hypothetical protein
VIEDGRELIFPIFSVPAAGDGIYLEQRVFLGTGFFVSKQGDAVTARHVLPSPEQLRHGHRLVAVCVCDGREQPCWITHAAPFDAWDVALLHVDMADTRYLPLRAGDVSAGTDVQFIGIADHEAWGGGKELRILKGHVTMAVPPWLELNCAVPRGMSGSPLLVGDGVAGCVVGTLRTEQLEDSVEEVTEVTGEGSTRRVTEVRAVVQYGRAFSFATASSVRHPVLDGLTLTAFVGQRNEEP